MAANNTLEVQVSLGLQGAQNQIQQLRQILQDAVSPNTASMKNITKELDTALRQVNKLRSEMATSFSTSAGAKKFLQDYDKVFDHIGMIVSSFSTLNLNDLKLPNNVQGQFSQLTKDLKGLEQEIDRIESGKIGKVFDDVNNVDFGKVRQAAKELNIDLSKTTFTEFSDNLTTEIEKANKEIADLQQNLKDLQNFINNPQINKDSIMNTIVSSSEYAQIANRTLTKAGADNLRTQLADVYKGYLGDDALKQLNLNLQVKQGASTNKLFDTQRESIDKSTQALIDFANARKADVSKAIQDLTDIKKMQKNPDGSRTNWQDRLPLIDKIKEQYKDLINFSSQDNFINAKTGKGIQGYIDQLIKELQTYSSTVDVSAIKTELQSKIETVINDALNISGATVDRISNINDFKSSITSVIQSVFNRSFNIDWSTIKNGISVESAINQIIAQIQSQISNTEIKDLDSAIQQLQATTSNYGAAQGVVTATAAADTAALTSKKDAAQALSQQIQDLLQATLALLNAGLAKGMKQDKDNIDQARGTLENYISTVSKYEKASKSLTNVSSAVTRWMGFYQVLNLTKRAIQDMKTHVQELDKVMTQIAVVTNMSQNDLWGQISTYSEIARQYGVAIKGVYEVSQIYYQQGLNKGDVMNLTTETLKMARIAGIDYATAADYMTTAVRGFKLEMSEATHVTDVFSNLAAHTASDTEELATAISKTASSAEAVGASFEATSAMIATMVSVTRESATNIGTALKSVISRYGEMTSDPSKMVDSEGEEMSLNRVDKALQTIGISIHDVNGQFRDFDDVILELGDKWDSIDKNAQRYIATIMAGNRQQSRFLALVGNVEEYRRALELANNSEDVGELQVLKTLDSVDAKIERMKVTIQEFYTSSGIQDLYKNILDTITNVIAGANELPKAFGNIPATAIAIGSQVIIAIKNVAQLVIALAQSSISQIKNSIDIGLKGISADGTTQGRIFGKNWYQAAKAEMEKIKNENDISTASAWTKTNFGRTIGTFAATGLSLLGASTSINSTARYGASTSANTDVSAGWGMIGATVANAASGAISGYMMGGPWGAAAGAIISGLPSLISAISMINVSLSRRLELAEKAETEAKQQATIDKGQVNDLQQAYDKLKQLSEAQYESADAMAEYHEYMNQLADSYPALVAAMEINGNQIITLEALERSLAQARADAAASTLEAVKREKDRILIEQQAAQKLSSGINNSLFDNNQFVNLSAGELMTLLNTQANLDTDLETGIKASNVLFDNSQLRFSQLDSSYAVLLAYNKAIEAGRLSERPMIDLNLPDGVDDEQQYYAQLYSKHIEEIQALANLYLFNNNEAIVQYKKVLEEAIKNNSDYNYAKLTGIERINNDNKDEILDSLEPEQLFAAIQHTREIAQDGLDQMANSLDIIDKSLSASSANVVVQNNLQANSKSSSGIDLTQYSNFLSSMIARMGGGKNINWSEGQNLVDANTAYNNLSNYIDQNQILADELINGLVYLQFSSIDKLNEFLESHNFTTEHGIDIGMIQSIQKDFTNSIQSVRKGLYGAIEAYVGSLNTGGLDTELWQLFDISNTEDNITAEIATILQSSLPQYKQLMDKGYTIAADNYLNGLTTLYQQIGQLSDDQQHDIAPILRELDLTDVESIDTAIKNFEALGLTDIVSKLTEIRERVYTNIGLTISSMMSETSKIAEEAEKALGNIGKGMDYSDALKTAQEIIAKSENKDRTADNLIEWNADLNKWVLTSEALEESYRQITEANQDRLAAINRQAEIIQDSSVQEAIKRLSADSTGEEITEQLGKIAGLSEPEQNILSQTLQQLQDQFKKEKAENKNLEWDTWVIDALNQYDQKELEFLQTYLQNSPLQYIASMDFDAIAGGTTSDTVYESFITYMNILGGEAAEKAIEIWEALKEANFKPLEDVLGIKISDTIKKQSRQTNAQQYTTLMEELLDNNSTTLSDASEALASQLGYKNVKKDPMMVKLLVEQLQTNMESLFKNGIISAEDYNKFIKAQAETNNKDVLKAKSVADMAKDGSITLDELETYANTYKIALSELYNKETNEFQDETLKGIYKYNPETNSLEADANASAEQIIAALAEAFGVTLAGFTDFATETIDSQIAQRAKDNKGKQIASQLQNLSSAKVGDEINVSSLTPEMQAAIGAVNGTVTISNEYLRDNLLLLLKTYIDSYEGEGKEALQAIYRTINDSIVSSRGTRGENLENIIQSSISLDDYRKELASRFDLPQIESYSDETIKALAKTKGYEYDEWSKQLIATEETLADIDAQIAEAQAPDSGATEQTIRELKQRREALATELNRNYENEALIGVLSSQENISDQALEAFKVAFNWEDYNEYFGTDALGNTFIKDFEGLKAEMGPTYAKIFDEYIATIADSYIDNISKAGSLAVSGTTSQVEIQGFQKAFGQLFNGETATFVYDALLDAWVLDTNDMHRMIEKSAEKLTFASDADRQAYIQNQLDNLFSENLDFSNFISGTATKKETSTLKGNLRRYFQNKFSGMTSSAGISIEEYVDQQVDDTLNIISKGGSEAVAKLKQVKPEATSEELEAAYNAQIAPIQAAAELVDSLEVGSFVATEHIEALTKAGFTIENNVVVSVATSLVEAYKNLYNQMAETGEATTEQLNNIGKQILNEQYRSARGGVDALAAGASMSTDAFIDLWTQQDMVFGNGTDAGVQQKLHELQNKGAISVSETGQVRFKDIDILASELGWNTASEEYKAAYSAWVDATISDNASRDVNTRIKTQISNLAGANVGDTVNIHDLSSEMKAALGVSAETDTLTILSEVQRDNWILALDASKEQNEAVKRAIIESQQAVKSKRNVATNTNAIIAMKVSQQAAQDFAIATENESINVEQVMRERGYVFNEYTQKWEATAAVLKNLSADLAAARENGTAEDVANLEAAYNKLKYELQNQRYNVIQDLVSNYQNLSEESIAAFQTAFANWGINIRDFIHTDEWGHNRVDLAGLNQKLAQVGYDVNELFQQEIAAIGDSYLQNISTGVSLLSSGTNNLSDLSSFVENYNQMLGTNLQIENVSYYDDILDAFTVRPEYIKKYIEAQAQQLKNMGILPEAKIDQWIKDNTIKAAQNNIDISSFLSGDRTQDDVNKLGRALETYYATVNRDINNATKDASYAIKALQAGGERAVNKAREIKPDLTESELAEIYSSAINRWNDALGEVEGIIQGQVVTGELRQVLSQLEMVDANGVVNETFNAVEVYSAIYEQMSNTAGATVSDLNNAYAKLLTANDQKRMDAQEALENAADMSFDTLAQLYSNYGKNIATILPDLVESGTVGLTGFGGIRIFDIDAFLGTLGLDASSPEYYELRNEYADAMTEFYNNTNNIIDSVVEQIQGLAEIKPGKAVNLSYLESVLPEGELKKVIGSYGEQIQNGIYVFNETVDIPKLIQATAEAAAKAGKLIPEQMAELADTISDMLADIASLISGGISGSLSNVDAQKLSSWANQYGINQLDFTTTEDGLKLSTNSAKELYQVIKNIDDIQGSIVFDALKESLIETQDEFKTISAQSIYIKDLRDKIANIDKYSDEKIEQYKQELALAEEILAARSTTEDDSFKFMDNKIPSGQNNPLNYWSNWYDAFAKMKKTSYKGKDRSKMAYEDFYNIVTEMGNIAAYTEDGINIGGRVVQNAEEASSLIEEAARVLTTTSTGDLAVKLGDIGIDFSSGVDKMAAGVDAGIEGLADEQIDMLDSMIQLLETVVAMEELGDIDIDEDNVLDLGEIFNVEYDPKDSDRIIKILDTYTDKFQTAAKKILDSAKDNEDLIKALDEMKITVNGQVVTMRDMFKDAENGVKSINIDAEAYTAILNSFYQAYLSGDYDLDHLFESIKSVLAGTGFEGDIDIGDMHLTFTAGTVITWSKDNKAIINGKETQFGKNDTDKIVSAMAAAEFDELLSNNYTIEESGEVTYHGAIDTTVEYNVESGVYTAHFEDGGEVTADSQQALIAMIKAYESLTEQDITKEGGAETSDAATSNVSITIPGKLTTNMVLEVVDGKWKVTDKGSETDDWDLEQKAQDTINALRTEKTFNTTLDVTGQVKTNADVAASTPAEQPVIPQDEVQSQIDDNKAYAQDNPAEQVIKNINNAVRDAIYQNVKAAQNNPARQKLIVSQETAYSGNTTEDIASVAKGNVALAQGTLMGELGPELYVTGGRYYIAGQNGAEFVNLPDDAIVFNHLQTRNLMNNGHSTRGKAYTSEERALAFATGNWNGGEAMASAASALSSLKQLRAMWQSLKDLTAKDLAGAAGGGGGGGGSNSESNKAFLKDLEKWYNWLQKIAQLETDITYQEQLRSKIQSDMVSHGQDYFQSQLVTLDKLEQSVTTRQDLVNSQEEYFNTRRQELNDQAYPFSSLYEFDEAGQLKYKDGQLANLSKLMGTNQYGEANYTAQEQYEMIVAMDPRFEEYMQYNDSGEKIEWEKDDEGNWKNEDYVTAVENFWDKIEADKEEMQSLHDSIEEGKKDILADYESINEILRDIEDNQISVENKVYEAMVDSRERAIQELEDTKDAIQNSADKLINGLQDQLNNEKDMYDQQAKSDDLTKLQRQLGILQRSGASAAEIAGIQAQITEKQSDAYFDEQQRQIDAIQQASDNELEKLQQQIDLETEMLEYEKEYGLLWSKVYEIMHGENAEGIAAYIAKNNSEYWGKSPTDLLKTQRDDLFEAQAYKDFANRFEGIETLINHYNNTNVGLGNNAEIADATTDTINGTTTTTTTVATAQGAASGGAEKSVAQGSWKQDNKGWWYENADGSYKQNEWMQENGIWYYFDKNGYMVTGAQTIDGKNYSFNGSGGLIGESSSNTGSNNGNQKGWHLEGVKQVFGSEILAKNAREALIQAAATSAEADRWAAAKIKYYSEGGLNDYTGLAMLHGTKTKPEGILNASQTSILRNEILSNKPNSLLSLLTSWRDSVTGLADTSSINNSYTDGVTIEKAEVIMQVSQIANDYDAQRAGEQALDKIINVARKTMAQNRIRR